MRFAAIATEVGTGHEVWLTRGSLSLALRASYALPGVFPPVTSAAAGSSTGRWSIPCRSRLRGRSARASSSPSISMPTVSAAAPPSPATARIPDDANPLAPGQARSGFPRLRNMFGAERALKRELIGGPARPSFSTVMVESFNIMQDRLTRMRLAGDPPDVHITPRIGHIGWLDFHRAAEAIEVGHAAAEKALDPICEIHRRVALRTRGRAPHCDGEMRAQVV